MKGCAATRVCRREVRRNHRFGNDALPFSGVNYPFGDELRQRRLVCVLELAAAAGGEVTARRRDTVWPGKQLAICIDLVPRYCPRHMLTIGRYAVAFCSNADDFAGFAHSSAA